MSVYRSSRWVGFLCRSTSQQQHCSSYHLGWNQTWSSSRTQYYLGRNFGSPMQSHPPKHSLYHSRQDQGRLPKVRTPSQGQMHFPPQSGCCPCGLSFSHIPHGSYSRHCRAARCSSEWDNKSLQIYSCNQKQRRFHLALCLGSGRRYIEGLRMRSLRRCSWTHHMKRTGSTCAWEGLVLPCRYKRSNCWCLYKDSHILPHLAHWLPRWGRFHLSLHTPQLRCICTLELLRHSFDRVTLVQAQRTTRMQVESHLSFLLSTWSQHKLDPLDKSPGTPQDCQSPPTHCICCLGPRWFLLGSRRAPSSHQGWVWLPRRRRRGPARVAKINLFFPQWYIDHFL